MPTTAPAPLTEAELDRLEHLLNALAEHDEAVPDLEQLDGFLAALACGPQHRPLDDALPALLGPQPPFADEAQREEFLALVRRRAAEVLRAVDAPVQRLDDERTLSPLLTDWDAVREHTPEAERGAPQDWPRLGAVWAGGFLQCVDAFEDDWLLPADDPGNEFVDGCLQLFEILASDEADMPPEARAMSPDERLADALWAVYDLRDFWRERASRQPVATVRKPAQPGRNAPCPCGSGKKYKKCHGAPGRGA
ncbi:MAG: hypothetical protein KatS3mg122_1741 [Caldimonas sp.]|nr:MAG: hypothetical protein KatS3mg122_1741 [Caldimonas sp.]